jgi:hypothetical protein
VVNKNGQPFRERININISIEPTIQLYGMTNANRRGFVPKHSAFDGSGKSVVANLRGNCGWWGLDRSGENLPQWLVGSPQPLLSRIQHRMILRKLLSTALRNGNAGPKSGNLYSPTDKRGQGAAVGTLAREPRQWAQLEGCSRIRLASLASLSWDPTAQLFRSRKNLEYGCPSHAEERT